MPAEERTLVLIVEDEALVRMHGCDVLESAGFQVLEADTADEAVALLERHPGVHLLFSDIDMPGSMDGLELAEIVHSRWPRIGLLLTSGHHRLVDSAIPDNGLFVPKPWNEDDIVDKLRSILDTK